MSRNHEFHEDEVIEAAPGTTFHQCHFYNCTFPQGVQLHFWDCVVAWDRYWLLASGPRDIVRLGPGSSVCGSFFGAIDRISPPV